MIMDTRHPHDIKKFRDMSELQKARESGEKLMPLTTEEEKHLTPLSPDERGEWMRKGRNRNKDCPCGSGKKFKKCCW